MSDTDSVSIDLSEGSKNLYIFFGGMAAGIVVPPFEFFNASQTLHENRIFIRDFRQCWYHTGLKGISTDLHSTAEFIANVIKRLSPEKVTFVGNSMGGFAAILFAHLIGKGRVVAFAPQTFVSRRLRKLHQDRRWKKQIRRLYFQTILRPKAFDLRHVVSSSPSRVPVSIFFSSNNVLDSLHASHVSDLDNVSLQPVTGGGHEVVKLLRDRGDLPAILS